jgi:hypothetical protein
MGWTWALTYREPVIGIDVHASIQREVGEIIRSYIKEKRPSVSEIRFLKLYTETITATQVRAVFKYSFVDSMSEDEDTEQVFEGQAILNKDPKSTEDEGVWTLDEVSADNKSVVFKKGIEIRPGSGEDSPEFKHQQTPEPRPAGPSSSEEEHG